MGLIQDVKYPPTTMVRFGQMFSGQVARIVDVKADPASALIDQLVMRTELNQNCIGSLVVLRTGKVIEPEDAADLVVVLVDDGTVLTVKN